MCLCYSGITTCNKHKVYLIFSLFCLVSFPWMCSWHNSTLNRCWWPWCTSKLKSGKIYWLAVYISLWLKCILILALVVKECRKTRTKIITLVSHSKRNECFEPIRIQNKINACNQYQAQEAPVSKSWLILVLLLICWQIGRSFAN